MVSHRRILIRFFLPYFMHRTCICRGARITKSKHRKCRKEHMSKESNIQNINRKCFSLLGGLHQCVCMCLCPEFNMSFHRILPLLSFSTHFNFFFSQTLYGRIDKYHCQSVYHKYYTLSTHVARLNANKSHKIMLSFAI